LVSRPVQAPSREATCLSLREHQVAVKLGNEHPRHGSGCNPLNSGPQCKFQVSLSWIVELTSSSGEKERMLILR
jgi:hypothetical protein